MNRLAFAATFAERTLLALTAALVLSIHSGGIFAPEWIVHAIPLGLELRELLPAVQVALLAAWIVLGPGPMWLRLPATPVLLTLWAVGWSSSGWDLVGVRPSDELLLATGTVALVTAIVIRCCGLTIGGNRQGAALARLPPQFSIRGLIVLTTLVAIVLGALEWLRPTISAQSDLWSIDEGEFAFVSHHWLTAPSSLRRGIMAAALAGASLAGLWSVLRPGIVWPRMLVTLTLVAVLGAYLAHLTGSERGPAGSLSLSLALQTVLVALSALPLRLGNVRLMRQRGTGFQPVRSVSSPVRLKTDPPDLIPETVS